MKALIVWLRGKKTYIVAGAIALETLVGVFLGKLSFGTATMLLGFAGGICGLGAKVERHAAQLTAVVADVAKAGGAVTVHSYGAAGKDAVQAVEDSVKLAAAIRADQG